MGTTKQKKNKDQEESIAWNAALRKSRELKRKAEENATSDKKGRHDG